MNCVTCGWDRRVAAFADDPAPRRSLFAIRDACPTVPIDFFRCEVAQLRVRGGVRRRIFPAGKFLCLKFLLSDVNQFISKQTSRE